MANAENKVVVTNFVEEVINQGHLERADDLVAVDFVELDPLPGQQQGREGLKQVISAFRAAFPDIHWVIEEMIGEGEKVFSRFIRRGDAPLERESVRASQWRNENQSPLLRIVRA
jgi:predicted SnoaL-like aldol condensation-catalyzing enzyme